jgi:hypothetical protein
MVLTVEEWFNSILKLQFLCLKIQALTSNTRKESMNVSEFLKLRKWIHITVSEKNQRTIETLTKVG